MRVCCLALCARWGKHSQACLLACVCSVQTVVAMCKLSDWDPDVFLKYKQVILTQAPSCAGPLQDEIMRGMYR